MTTRPSFITFTRIVAHEAVSDYFAPVRWTWRQMRRLWVREGR